MICKRESEIILSIKEIDGFKLPEESYYYRYEGYSVKTSKQEILILISSEGLCCESFGYLSTPDDKSKFIGAALFDIKIVDGDYDKIPIARPDYDDYKNACFVQFETSIGQFELAVYNVQNGYYRHDIKVISNQVTVEKMI